VCTNSRPVCGSSVFSFWQTKQMSTYHLASMLCML
jgi:hypothetical protein